MSADREEGRRRPSSDAPMDLLKEREAFVRTFLRKGVELTEELLRENTELREEIAALRADNARLETALKSDDAIRELLSTIEGLEHEKRALLARSERLRTEPAITAHHHEVEQELSDLANLYVASAQLHTSLSPRRVVRHLCDTLGQLVGARRFVVYVVDAERGQAVPVGCDEAGRDRPEPVVLGDGPVGEACVTGIARVLADPTAARSGEPLAVVPLLAEGRTVAAIAILSLLEQKQAWAPVDHELFKLIGAQAGLALIAANLYAQTDSPLTAVMGLAERVKASERS